MGEVYRARDGRLGRDVAIKVLPLELRTSETRLVRFEQEARAAGTLNHPNIVVLFDVGSFEDAPFLVTELLDGTTLRKHMSGGRLPVRRALDWAVQIANGLAAAHEKGITHRDLKPENIFVTDAGIVKILDFGVAKLTQPEESSQGSGPTIPNLTDPDAAVGTPAYMSPEQVRGQPVDHRSDLFSFGSLLHEMLRGQRAFAGSTAADVMGAILRDEPVELAGVPPAVERIVRRCLEKSPAQRFQSARDVAFALEAVSAGSGTSTAAATPVTTRKGSPWPLLAALIAIAAAAIGIVVGNKWNAPSVPAPQSPPTYRRVTNGRGKILSARFAPDGQTLVYSAAWNGAPAELFVVRADSEPKALGIKHAHVLAISGSGEMAISIHPDRFPGTLARVPLLGGTPREVLEDVYFADYAPDGNLAVLHEVAGKLRLEFPIGTVLLETDAGFSYPRVSPDGKQIAFFDHPFKGDDMGYVVVMPVGGSPKRITREWMGTSEIAWSPDGREVLFSAQGPTPADSWPIYAVPAVGGPVRTVARAPTELRLHDVARDGRILAADRWVEQDIRYVSAKGEPGPNLAAGYTWGICTDLAPDGSQFLFSQGFATSAGGDNYGTFLRRTDGSPAILVGDAWGMQLSQDGKWVLATVEHPSPAHLVLLPTGAGQARRLPLGDHDVMEGRLLADGKRIVFAAKEAGQAGRRLFVSNLDGSSMRALIDWRGEGLAVNSDRVAVREGDTIILVSLVEGQPRRIPVHSSGLPLEFTADGKALLLQDFGSPGRIDRLDLASEKIETLMDVKAADPAGVRTLQVLFAKDMRSHLLCTVRQLDTLHVLEFAH
jgi:Tol biopolymer transport system component